MVAEIAENGIITALDPLDEFVNKVKLKTRIR
jgi:hypothetical protein